MTYDLHGAVRLDRPTEPPAAQAPRAVELVGDLLPRCGAATTLATCAARMAREPIADVVRDMHGGYAAAVHGEGGQLTLVRDGVGRWPLFWAEHARRPGEVHYGTSAVAVARASGRTGLLRDDVVEEFWTEGFVRPIHTLFDGVHDVDPGSVTTLSWPARGELQVGITRCVPAPGPRYREEGLNAAAERVGELLREAMTRVLHDVETCGASLTLSGGVDSTIVAAMAARHRADGLRAITLGALVPLTQDEPYARYAARRLGLSLSVYRPHLRSLATTADAALRGHDQPLDVAKSVVPFGASRHAARHGAVIVTGDCADGVFLGGTDHDKWLSTGPSPVDRVCSFGPRLPEWIGPRGRDQAANHAVGHLVARHFIHSRSCGVQVRSPFLDWDLMSYARSIPREMMLSDRSKDLLKRQLDGWPGWFVDRRKKGFTYNLRLAWAAQGCRGIREAIDDRAIARFEAHVPAALRAPASRWSFPTVLRHFHVAVNLMAWSAFERRLDGEDG